MNVQLTLLERKALDTALAGSAPWLEPLRQQVSQLRVVSREYTGYGFFTEFDCDGCVAAHDLPPSGSSDRVPSALAAHPEVEGGGRGGIVFLVFLEDGLIACLEAASTTAWPETEELITL